MDEAIKFLINEKIIDNKDRLIAVNDIQRQ
jgi:hypothetical protein